MSIHFLFPGDVPLDIPGHDEAVRYLALIKPGHTVTVMANNRIVGGRVDNVIVAGDAKAVKMEYYLNPVASHPKTDPAHGKESYPAMLTIHFDQPYEITDPALISAYVSSSDFRFKEGQFMNPKVDVLIRATQDRVETYFDIRQKNEPGHIEPVKVQPVAKR
ncbi:hypothetical protein ACQ7NP_12855 [Pseudomonas anuradhapurensis]